MQDFTYPCELVQKQTEWSLLMSWILTNQSNAGEHHRHIYTKQSEEVHLPLTLPKQHSTVSKQICLYWRERAIKSKPNVETCKITIYVINHTALKSKNNNNKNNAGHTFELMYTERSKRRSLLTFIHLNTILTPFSPCRPWYGEVDVNTEHCCQISSQNKMFCQDIQTGLIK